MSAAIANQRTVIEVLRLAPPEGMDRWTPALVARHSRLSSGQVSEAIRSLRNTGKIKFGPLELSASMLADNQEYQAKAGDDAGVERASEAPVESVSRGAGARAPAATSELMDATAGEAAPDHEQVSNHGGVIAPIDPVGKPVARTDDVSAGGKQKAGTAGNGRQRGNCSTNDHGETAAQPINEPATDSFAPPGQGEVAAAGGTPPATGHTPIAPDHSPSPSQVLGAALLIDVEAYLARTRMGTTLLGDLMLGHAGFVGVLRKRGLARPETARMVRDFMARWPEGTTRDQVRAWNLEIAEDMNAAIQMASVAAAPGQVWAGWITPAEVRRDLALAPSHPDAVKAEAPAMGARRRSARCTGMVANPLSTNVVGLQAALLAEPEDAFLFLRRQWPQLLRGVIARAHDEETTPATMLARVIEAGLICVAEDLREQAA